MPHSPTIHLRTSYRPTLFDAQHLTSIELVQCAIQELDAHLKDPKKIDRVLRDILENEGCGVLAVVLSGLESYSLLSDWVAQTFPKTATAFNTSLPPKILLEIAGHLTHNSQLTHEDMTRIAEIHLLAQKTARILDCASKATFINTVAIDAPGSSGRVKQTQRAAKNARKATKIDIAPFTEYGVDVPSTKDEATQIIDKVLETQRSHLLECFNILRKPVIALALQTKLIAVSLTEETSSKTFDVVTAESPADPALACSTAQETNSAFSSIQPIKSALYFDSVEGFGDWTVVISKKAEDVLRSTCKKDRTTFGIIVKKIGELSHGHFSADNMKKLAGPNVGNIPIYEAKMARDSRLIYQIDCVATGGDREQQAIRVFDICTHARMDGRMWKSIAWSMANRGKEYRHRCITRIPVDGHGTTIFKPAVFPPLPDVAITPATLPDLLEVNEADVDEADTDEVNGDKSFSRLIMEKYTIFSKPVLNAIMANIEVTFPHLVSSQEKVIIEHPDSCYVIGRSGTGKTTTMLFKMLLVERSYQLSDDSSPRPRQIFVTQSKMLARKVNDYFKTLTQGLVTASWSDQELRERANTLEITGGMPLMPSDDLVDEDEYDDSDEWGKLPERFSTLEDGHFPVITTVEKLFSMLEADMACSAANKKKKTDLGPSRTLLSYKVFLREYWPHFPQSLTKHLDPALVYSEVLGVIMGSEESLLCRNGYLDLQAYKDISSRNQATFSNRREEIYDLFENYLKRKAQRREMDAAERTHRIIDFLHNTKGALSQKVDRLYVDEVQDNLLIDTLILRAICKQNTGLFWAGDTAQTISVGSSFRFDDLKAFQYRLEERNLQHKASSRRTPDLPKLFQLAVNYRSHSGIVNCAHTVIDLITMFWPESIDKLAPEHGVAQGLKPVFFNGWQAGSVHFEQFLFGDSGNHIEFGAQQCIIVRDDDARDELRATFGEVGLILTIYETKGLEFNDVLLYNFFQNSSVDVARWRVVLNAVESCNIPAPAFDAMRHASVCVELKYLYVAITRARENVWIADCSDKGEPMRSVWNSRSLIQNFTPGKDAPRLATSSAPEEWAETGTNLFERKLYKEAMHCFERAKMEKQYTTAKAYHTMQQAEKIPEANQSQRQKLFREAAETFQLCINTVQDFRKAMVYYRHAGRCWRVAGGKADKAKAAEAFFNSEDFEDAAQLCDEISEFDDAVWITKVRRERINPNTASRITAHARMFYFKEHKISRAVELFENADGALQYLEARDLDVERASLLESLDRKEEAADLHLSEGRVLMAIALYLRTEETVKRGYQCIVDGIWEKFSFGNTLAHLGDDQDLTALLGLSRQVDPAKLHMSDRAELRMFQAIHSNSFHDLLKLATEFLAYNRRGSALLCFDHYFSSSSKQEMQTTQSTALASFVPHFATYLDLLHNLARHTFTNDQPNNSGITRLLRIVRISENSFLIPSNTWLYRQLNNEDSRILPQLDLVDGGIRASIQELQYTVQHTLSERLRARIAAHDRMMRTAAAVRPCAPYVVMGCPLGGACHHEHVKPATLEVYNARVRVSLQHIIICQLHHHCSFDHKRFWIGRFYDALHPSHHLLGSTASLDLSLIPEGERGLYILKDWIRYIAYTIKHFWNPDFLTDLSRIVSLGLYFDRHHALDFLPQGRYVKIAGSSQPPAELLRDNGKGYLPHDILLSWIGRHYACLSSGALAIAHILNHSLPIGINVLCEWAEYTVASLVLAGFSQRRNGFHGVLLPRTWLLQYLGDTQQHRKRELVYKNAFLDPLGELLQRLYSGQGVEHLFRMRFSSREVRNIYILRICRVLALFGYNDVSFSSDGTRQHILQLFKGFRERHPAIPGLYRDIIYAEAWPDVTKWLRRSTVQGSLDELIDLRHSNFAPLRPVMGIRTVVYDKVEEIQALILTAPLPPAPTRLPNLSSHTLAAEAEVEDPHAQTGLPEVEEPGPEIEETAAEPLKAEEELKVAEPTPKEREAVASIERHWLVCSSRTAEAEKVKARRGRSVDALDTFFEFCLKGSHDIRPGLYRVMMRGFLPYILSCLDALEPHLNERKKTAKILFTKVQGPEDYDNVDKELTSVSTALRRIKEYQRLLLPPSAFHKQQNVSELRKVVTEIKGLWLELPTKPEGVDGNIEFGYEVIVTREQRTMSGTSSDRTSTSKPKLNVQDLDDW